MGEDCLLRSKLMTRAGRRAEPLRQAGRPKERLAERGGTCTAAPICWAGWFGCPARSNGATRSRHALEGLWRASRRYSAQPARLRAAADLRAPLAAEVEANGDAAAPILGQ